MHPNFVTVKEWISSSAEMFFGFANELSETKSILLFITELATWLVGSAIVVDGDDLAADTHENSSIIHTDCLLNIIIENAQDNQDILLPTLQFVEVLYFRQKSYFQRNP